MNKWTYIKHKCGFHYILSTCFDSPAAIFLLLTFITNALHKSILSRQYRPCKTIADICLNKKIEVIIRFRRSSLCYCTSAIVIIAQHLLTTLKHNVDNLGQGVHCGILNHSQFIGTETIPSNYCCRAVKF